ncbi:hypothetical protein D3C76_191250 [compost metagenome]
MRFERMMKNIRFDLFDVSRLMIEDSVKLKAFHNEITFICNEVLLELEKHTNFANDSDEEKRIIYEILEYEQTSATNIESLYDKLHELIHFTYQTYNKNVTQQAANKKIIDGFLKRAKRIIKVNIEEEFIKKIDGVIQRCGPNKEFNTFNIMEIGDQRVVSSVPNNFDFNTKYHATDAKY